MRMALRCVEQLETTFSAKFIMRVAQLSILAMLNDCADRNAGSVLLFASSSGRNNWSLGLIGCPSNAEIARPRDVGFANRHAVPKRPIRPAGAMVSSSVYLEVEALL